MAEPARQRAWLEDALRARWESTCEVTGFEQLAGGASRQTWRVDVRTASGPDRMVLQRAVGETFDDTVSPEVQAALLQAAAGVDVPVPPVRLLLEPDDGLGRGFVTGFVPGEAHPKRILRDPDLATARGRLAGQCGRALARLHSLDPDEVAGLPDFTADGTAVEHHLDGFVSVLDRIGEPHPAFELAMQWLRADPPAPRGRVLVHGDFRNGNLLVAPDGLGGVLDWELAHVGDPVEDLGWLCVRAWRFGVDDLPVGGFGTREDLLGAYERATGLTADEADVRRWELLGALRWGVICMLQASRHLDGDEQSLELAAIGRRVCETEYDVLALLAELDPDTYPEVAVDDRVPAGAGEGLVTNQDRPAAHQLLEAVAAHLAEDVVPGLDGRPRFHTQVAANVCRMLQREVRHGPQVEDRARRRMHALVGDTADPRSELAAGLRRGDIDHRDREVAETLLADACDRLRIANPRHLVVRS